MVKVPPTYTLPPLIAIALTLLFTPLLASPPTAYHWLVALSHRATLLAVTSPAVANKPPTYTLLPLIAIAWTISFTSLPTPVFSACHWLPSQRATWLALEPPAMVK